MLVTLSLSCGLTGCATVLPAAVDSRVLYQPPVLRLPAGQPVQTMDGIHTPQVPEVWHSDARYRALEAEVVDAMAALATLQQREGAR